MRNRLLAALTCLFLAPQALAEPGFARLYKQQYGYMPSCNACHKDGGGTPVNGFTGGTTATVFTNDTLNGAGFANGAVIATIANAGGLTNVSINANGTITVPANTPAGTYTVQYQICEA